MELPSEKSKVEAVNPKSMIVFGPPKMGKTTLMAQLEDALIFDLEKGSKFVECMKLEINSYEDLLEALKALKKMQKEKGRTYKYGVMDTTTRLEDLILPLAAQLYRQTPMGKKWGIDANGKALPDADVTTLANGAGYRWTRIALNKISNTLEGLFEHVIFICHIKEKSITKDGSEINTTDIALTGKMAQILPANVDAVGYLHRDRKGNQFLNFQASDELVAGARPAHLLGQDIEIVSNKNGVLTYHWDKVFLPEK